MNGPKYRHKGNGNIYTILEDLNLEIKQTSDNEWEPSIVYISLSTGKIYSTGESRFFERFEEVEE